VALIAGFPLPEFAREYGTGQGTWRRLALLANNVTQTNPKLFEETPNEAKRFH
jgi:hypothetical protein